MIDNVEDVFSGFLFISTHMLLHYLGKADQVKYVLK